MVGREKKSLTKTIYKSRYITENIFKKKNLNVELFFFWTKNTSSPSPSVKFMTKHMVHMSKSVYWKLLEYKTFEFHLKLLYCEIRKLQLIGNVISDVLNYLYSKSELIYLQIIIFIEQSIFND